MIHYYRNDSYAGEKGQYAKYDGGEEAEFIAKEFDGTMKRTIENKRGGHIFEDPEDHLNAWFEVDKSEWDAIALEYDKWANKRDKDATDGTGKES